MNANATNRIFRQARRENACGRFRDHDSKSIAKKLLPSPKTPNNGNQRAKAALAKEKEAKSSDKDAKGEDDSELDAEYNGDTEGSTERDEEVEEEAKDSFSNAHMHYRDSKGL
ncbi:hypothetical protein K432DRAFT_441613 [Lepidopterella palustris CBS 459.81]|uniref:Uncharacterized protein n=1 Tax=Lepidopterella palustris CBS 459.81 TaxID=1314670 RepID=A0A8E2JHD4_9PEZI|nr:hypothetical protein K432DRAFT_441613 [Lepidopterella palustris CBS 459.81]